MPLNPIDFSRFTQKRDSSQAGDIVSDYFKGYELSRLPHKIKNDELIQALKSKILGTESEYAGPLSEAKLRESELHNQYYPRLQEAHIQSALASAQRARMGGDFSGAAGNIVRLEQLKQSGAHPELVKKLEDQISFERKREEGIYNYQQQMANSMYYRSAPPQQKLLMNIDQLGQNKTFDLEGNEVNLTPEQAEQRRNLLTKEVVKNTSDPEQRERLRYAANFNTTLENIDPEKAFKYSGGFGSFAKIAQKGLGGLNAKQSEEYKDYQREATKLQIAAHQASQFFGLAAAQKIQDHVNYLVNPENIYKHPEVAMAQFETLKDIFRQEHDNLLKSTVNSDVYGVNIAPSGNNRVKELSQKIQTSSRSKAVKRVLYKGQIRLVPEDKVEDAIKAGGKLI